MRSIFAVFITLLISLNASSQAALNVVFKSHVTFPGKTCANICGYVDSTGREYALIGVETGMEIYDVTNPTAPFFVKDFPWPPGPQQLWKEIKTYKHYAYVTSEAGSGLQIVNLKNLPGTNLPDTFWVTNVFSQTLNSIHALHVDTTKGNIYLYGSNIGNKGAICASLANPWKPQFLGVFNNTYVHDGYVDNDTLWAGEIYDGVFEVIDFTNKTSPNPIVSVQTPNTFTHNTWLTPDRKFLLTTDETSSSVLAAYDVSNLSNITLVDTIHALSNTSIVHNTHIRPDWFAVTSWYKDGFTIVDCMRPHNLVTVGYYDTYPAQSGSGFEGAWGVYPFLPSGTIVVSNIDEGLYVLAPTYMRACWLEGNVKDSVTSANLSGVSVQVSSVNLNTTSLVNGDYATGTVSAGTYNVQFSKSGYQSRTINNVVLQNGVLTTLNVKLLPNGFGINTYAPENSGIMVSGNPFKGSCKLKFFTDGNPAGLNEIKIFDQIGKVIFEYKTELNEGEIQAGAQFAPGLYFVTVNNSKAVKIIKAE